MKHIIYISYILLLLALMVAGCFLLYNLFTDVVLNGKWDNNTWLNVGLLVIVLISLAIALNYFEKFLNENYKEK
ncbi:hypothetical protein HCW_02020 [Helicobacter cetorum MIT 00-7128]|uniref:Lipoprotein n=1 Tax=Helicobacter cetorum (strain ATCC BAA-429 / MIT 00-7128) TaxID=182217 RepID=I0EL70_HELC0|nr:hypothetical protein HCW_02020 [Helicobacter cetorum MIT 00-7128]